MVARAREADAHWATSEHGKRALRHLHELGQPLLLGSDTPSAPTYGNQPGYDTYKEMQLMVEVGIPLSAIFAAGTINNARQLGLDKDYGTIEKGKIANLLLLDANPLASVEAPCQYSLNSASRSKARTIGWHPSACTAIIFGRFAPIHPSCSSSANAFHMPIIPTPPPAG
jgi:hypothetical protein